jgi:hypothetical protein
MDGNTWSVLDSQNTRKLDGPSITKIFECHGDSVASDFYRYIRLTQTGKNSSENDYLPLANIEFFGSIKQVSQTRED